MVKMATEQYNTSHLLGDIVAMLPIGIAVFTKDMQSIELCSKEIYNIFQISPSSTTNDQLYQEIIKLDISEHSKCIEIKDKSYMAHRKVSNEGWVIVSLTDISIAIELNHVKYESMIKTNMMQTLRHEVRTPLSGIVGVIYSLRNCLKPILDPESKMLISVAKYSCNMISNLLNNFNV